MVLVTARCRPVDPSSFRGNVPEQCLKHCCFAAIISMVGAVRLLCLALGMGRGAVTVIEQLLSSCWCPLAPTVQVGLCGGFVAPPTVSAAYWWVGAGVQSSWPWYTSVYLRWGGKCLLQHASLPILVMLRHCLPAV